MLEYTTHVSSSVVIWLSSYMYSEMKKKKIKAKKFIRFLDIYFEKKEYEEGISSKTYKAFTFFKKNPNAFH